MRNEVSAVIVATLGAIAVNGCGQSDTERLGGADEAVVAGAAFTTFDATQGGCLHGNGNGINCNHYASKPDVYMNGGPTANGLSDGTYYFTVLTPGSQNGGFLQGAVGNLSDDTAHGGNDQGIGDSIADRTFVVNGHQIVQNSGTHVDGTSPNGKAIIQLYPFDDTSNPGGVYILAVCRVGATSPSQCKFDEFKVEKAPPPPPPCCGDGHLDPGEECDDHNTTSGDGCSSTCMIEPPPPQPCCGDGHLDPGEECDDHNTTSGDGCSSTCMIEPPPPTPCCGDGHVDPGEECDDHNTTSGDGCSSTCMIEPPPPTPCCGDGHVDPGEECDDHNTTSGDGCSSTCMIEPPS